MGGPTGTSCFFLLTPQRPSQDTADSLPWVVGASGDSEGGAREKDQTGGKWVPWPFWSELRVDEQVVSVGQESSPGDIRLTLLQSDKPSG